MSRLVRFEEHRWLGDKRVQLVHDQDNACDTAVLQEIHDAHVGLCFGPDTAIEASNRGYRVPGVRRKRIRLIFGHPAARIHA